MKKRIILLFFIFISCVSCAPTYNCNDKNTLDTVKQLSLDLLRRDYGLLATDINVDLITLNSRNEKTGQITCNAQVNYTVTDQIDFSSLLRGLLGQVPSTGHVEYTVDQDQTNDLRVVIRVRLYQLH